MKKLTAATIIPDTLYVERSADRQLKEIIKNMGRPGYVLVARQMGKTNLLLHTKAHMENAANIFVYVDLSRSFESDRECFRYIIDVALDSHANHFKDVREKIQSARIRNATAPYREHECELLILLECCSERLVIILDEIDYLTNTTFSDKIFAQIRSIYFSRASYTGLNKLTYVLSGVADPTQLIKDKKVSPFNIGQKIFLDDFSLSEYESFIEKAGLGALAVECKERIYYWTKGNPRMTWDICSEIEDRHIAGLAVAPSDIDAVVKELYLLRFDRAPIDHIRLQVDEDRQIREAVMSIRSGKGAALIDDMRARLYLAGILASSSASSLVQIKNPIIDRALSDQWLKDLSIKHSGLLQSAVEQYKLGDYAASLSLFNQYLAASEFPVGTKMFYYSMVAFCCYLAREPQVGLDFLDKAESEKGASSELHSHCRVIRGMCLLEMINPEAAAEQFQQALLDEKVTPGDYYEARLFLATSKIESKILYNYREINDDLTDIVKRLGEQKSEALESRNVVRFHRLAYLNLAHNGKLGGATANEIGGYLRKALEYTPAGGKPSVYLQFTKLVDDPALVESALREACVLVLAGNSSIVQDKSTIEAGLRVTDAINLLAECHLRSWRREYDDLIAYLRSKHDDVLMPADRMHFAMALYAMQSGRDEGGIALLRELLDGKISNMVSASCGLESCRLLFGRAGAVFDEAYFRKYQHYLETESSAPLIYNDLVIFAKVLNRLWSEHRYVDCLSISKWIELHQERIPTELSSNLLLFAFYRALSLTNTRASRDEILETANDILVFESKLPRTRVNTFLLSEKDTRAAFQYARSLVKSLSYIPIVKNELPKIARNALVNVRYSDGRIVRAIKFKRVEADLSLGLCRLLQERQDEFLLKPDSQ